jgi:Tfp pilus assembly protein PilF
MPEIEVDPTEDITEMPVDPVGSPPRPRPPKVSAAEHTRNGLNAFVRGDQRGALALYRKAIAVDAGHAPAWRAAGIAHERLGDKAAAKSAFQRYLQLAPKAADAGQIKQRLENL